MNKKYIKVRGMLLTAGFLAMPLMAGAVTNVVYQHDFSGSAASNLLGTVTDVGGGTWTSGGASASFKADGSVVTNSKASGIWLPVSIEQGGVYTLSADVDLTAGNWLSLGYATFSPDNAFFSAGGYGTALVKGTFVDMFAGVNTGGKTTAYGGGSGVQELSIVLDASDADSANWTMEFFEGGVSVAGPVIAASGDYGNIAFVGFSTAALDVTGAIDNFSLTAVLPDPEPDPLVTTFYQDEFTGDSETALLGTQSDFSVAAWQSEGASASFMADGSIVTNAAGSGIWVPVAVETGKVYTLSADIDLTASGGWISLGYAQFRSDNPFFGSAGYGTVIVKPAVAEVFPGLNTVGGSGGSFTGAGTGVQQLQVVLDATDTNSANWTVEFFEGGVSVAGPLTAASGDFGDIRFAGITTSAGTVTGAVDNFKLTTPGGPLINLSIDGADAIVSWLGQWGYTYALQGRSSLTAGGWTDVVPDIVGIDGVMSATNATGAAEFYQVTVD